MAYVRMGHALPTREELVTIFLTRKVPPFWTYFEKILLVFPVKSGCAFTSCDLSP
jgi:hypothetical protein